MKIKKEVIDRIIAHAKKTAPIEACGYLAAREGVILRHYELTNMDESQEHFSFDPEEQFEVMRAARADELELCAVYHSHPATPARPSEEDIKLAFDPALSYVIVSLANGEENVKSFKIRDSNVKKEELEVANGN